MADRNFSGKKREKYLAVFDRWERIVYGTGVSTQKSFVRREK